MNYSRALLEETVVNRITQLFPDMGEIEMASMPYRKKVNLDMTALQIILYDLNNDRINFKQYTIGVMDKILNTSLLQSKDEIILQYTFEVYYKTIIVLYMSYLPQNQVELFQTPEELYEMYPEYRFENTYENDLWCDLTKAATRLRKKRTDAAVIERYLMNMHSTEIDLILIFRNFMRLCLMMIPPEGNKNILLKVVAKLEGAGQSYITGGDPRPATRRRIRVYEKESGIKAKRKNACSASPFPSNTLPISSLGVGAGSGGGGGGANGLLSLLVETSGAALDPEIISSQNGGPLTSSRSYPSLLDAAGRSLSTSLLSADNTTGSGMSSSSISSLAQAAAALSSAASGTSSYSALAFSSSSSSSSTSLPTLASSAYLHMPSIPAAPSSLLPSSSSSSGGLTGSSLLLTQSTAASAAAFTGSSSLPAPLPPPPSATSQSLVDSKSYSLPYSTSSSTLPNSMPVYYPSTTTSSGAASTLFTSSSLPSFYSLSPPLTPLVKKARTLDDFCVKYSLSDLIIPEVPELECLLYSKEINCSCAM